MYNKIILIGHLTKDPELRYTPQGTPVCNFRIAVNTRISRGGDRKEEVLFIDIVTFSKQAENSSQYLAKGKSMLVEGRLQERRWEADGQQKSKVEVIAAAVKFLPSKKENAGGDKHHDAAPKRRGGRPRAVLKHTHLKGAPVQVIVLLINRMQLQRNASDRSGTKCCQFCHLDVK